MDNLKKRQLQIAATNSKDFNLNKAVEEFSELILILTQRKTKLHTNNPIEKQEIIDEIGDAKRMIWVLEEIYGKKEVKKRIKRKLKQLETKKQIK